MMRNVGAWDRALRVAAGLALIAWAMGVIPGIPASVWGWIGIVPLATGLAGTCPAYSILGITTCPKA